jgi:hypothetical protein
LKILSASLYRMAAVALLLSAASAIHAQLPVNDQVWKDRCNLLAASSNSIQTGKLSEMFLTATRGVPSRGFLVLAVNRAQAGQHYVACTMYYLAAVAARAGNGGKPDLVAATNDAIVAHSEWKLARHHHLNMQEHMKRVEMKVEEITGQPLSLTPVETSAVLDASSTMPITLTH